ncbi:unnamed protein product [Adineta ricciae]|uniref:NAD(P)(+)--arginine ADP-ribosyltransferase n=1 Tax=Adineta ricciae TaxID=249248 RepID=A0A816ETV1_ADIRI|nr:unnamed protein product [Adineta ricciae]CAF1651833.1 unnamed protein product [Adineta ricciae]
MGIQPLVPVTGSYLDLDMNNQCYINCPILRTVYGWHLNDEYNSALKKAERFRSYYEELYRERHWLIKSLFRSNATVKDSIYAFKKGYLDYIDKSRDINTWQEISNALKSASENEDSKFVVYAYTLSQTFGKIIKKDMARNTFHEFTLYCTPLNCTVLACTQDGIQAFLASMFHSSLKDFVCEGHFTVYRGAVIDDLKLLEGYENGSVIITTTFLSTSTEQNVSNTFKDRNSNNPNEISVSCTYLLHNRRHTALNISSLSAFPMEGEILLYPYVPFRIISFEKHLEQKQINVVLEEIDDVENCNAALFV